MVDIDDAIREWAIPLGDGLCIDKYNDAVGDVFIKAADIILDTTVSLGTIKAVPVHDNWSYQGDVVYAIVINGGLVKIGGTKNGLVMRWSSYMAGRCVRQRLNRAGVPYSGKMSVTNARVYHTIEKALLDGYNCSVYIWILPRIEHTLNIFGHATVTVVRVYDCYEAACIRMYTRLTSAMPLLCIGYQRS